MGTQITGIEKANGMTREQVELIKASVARGASDLELKLFLYQCQRTGLDPLSRQIHFVKRGDQGTIQTGIDGYRVMAERTRECAGIDDAKFEYVEGDPAKYPLLATVTVYRLVQGQKCSFTATARWSEYFPSNEKQQFFWKKMPCGQLAKCAEALALRKAFPAELSGVYTHEEMQQAGPEVIQVGAKVVEANTQEAADAVRDEKLKAAGFSDKHAALKEESEAKRSAIAPEPQRLIDGEQIISGNLSSVSDTKKTVKGEPFVSIEIGPHKMNIFDKALFQPKDNELAALQKFYGKEVRAIVNKKGKYLNLVSMSLADEPPPPEDEGPPVTD